MPFFCYFHANRNLFFFTPNSSPAPITIRLFIFCIYSLYFSPTGRLADRQTVFASCILQSVSFLVFYFFACTLHLASCNLLVFITHYLLLITVFASCIFPCILSLNSQLETRNSQPVFFLDIPILLQYNFLKFTSWTFSHCDSQNIFWFCFLYWLVDWQIKRIGINLITWIYQK